MNFFPSAFDNLRIQPWARKSLLLHIPANGAPVVSNIKYLSIKTRSLWLYHSGHLLRIFLLTVWRGLGYFKEVWTITDGSDMEGAFLVSFLHCLSLSAHYSQVFLCSIHCLEEGIELVGWSWKLQSDWALIEIYLNGFEWSNGAPLPLALNFPFSPLFHRIIIVKLCDSSRAVLNMSPFIDLIPAGPISHHFDLSQ